MYPERDAVSNNEGVFTNAVTTAYDAEGHVVSQRGATYPVDYAYDEFGDIGNRETSSERGTNSVYAANQLNQYTAVDGFTPQFDDDGNQTLVKTATGIWSVTYNGENRPIRWDRMDSSTSSIISMSYDRMGRRVTKNAQRFVYDGYLCIGKIEDSTSIHYSLSPIHCFVWDPTEPVATRPLAWLVLRSLGEGGYYSHDGNKNASEVIASDGSLAAHYDYAPFGAVAAQRGTSAASNPWRFSSEYAEDDTATVYYNYRHYEPVTGRWMSRDPIEEDGGWGLYLWCANNSAIRFDTIGAKFITPGKDGNCPMGCCDNEKVQLVPVWSCKRTLKWSDNTETGPISWYHNITALYHQYLCCDGVNSNCYGVHAGSKKGDIIHEEVEPSGHCETRCVCPKEKADACSGCATMPEDYHIGPHGIDCQEWVDGVSSFCAK